MRISDWSSDVCSSDLIVPAIEGTHRVYTVQVNGFGGGDPGKNLAPGILDGIVADLDAFMAANKLSGAAVVGHSMGGLVGLMLAKAHPGDVGKLMVVDALTYVGVIYVRSTELLVGRDGDST